MFRDFDLQVLGVPQEAWPTANGVYKGSKSFTIRSRSGAVSCLNMIQASLWAPNWISVCKLGIYCGTHAYLYIYIYSYSHTQSFICLYQMFVLCKSYRNYDQSLFYLVWIESYICKWTCSYQDYSSVCECLFPCNLETMILRQWRCSYLPKLLLSKRLGMSLVVSLLMMANALQTPRVRSRGRSMGGQQRLGKSPRRYRISFRRILHSDLWFWGKEMRIISCFGACP